MPPEEHLKLTLTRLARRLRWLRTEAAAVTFCVAGVVAATGMLLAYKVAAAPALYLVLAVVALVGAEAGLVVYYVRRRRETWFAMVLVAVALVGAAGMYLVSDAIWLPGLWHIVGVTIGLSVAAGIAYGALRKVTLRQAAALADARLGLKERLSSAVAFLGEARLKSGLLSPLVPALIEDAAARAADVTPRGVAPHSMPWRVRYLTLAVAVLAAASFLPNDLFRSPREVAVRQALRDQGRRLQEEARRLEREAKQGKLKTAPEVARKLAELGRQFEQAKLKKKEALLQSGDLAEELRELQKRMEAQMPPRSTREALEALKQTDLQSEAAQALADTLRRQDSEALQKQLDDLAKKLEQGQLSAEEQQKLATDLQQMAAALDQSPLQGVAQSISAAAKSLQANRSAQAAQSMSKAAQAARQGASQSADAEALAQAIKQLEQSQKDLADADQPCPECGGAG